MQVTPQLAQVIIAVIFLFLLLAIRRRRESILHWLRRAIFVEATYVGVTLFLAKLGKTTPLESVLGGVVAALIVMSRMPGRSRHIPKSVRRKKIAEFEYRTGKKFNPRKHELDHEVPFSRGGSHTDDNLRVVEKRKNRAKGAKSPWWDLLGR
jgi:hypothetical protein